MPVARFRIEDGRIARFEVPEGTTPEQAQSMIEQALAAPAKEPQRSTGETIARQVGLTARAGIEGLTALPNMVGDALGLRSTEAVSQGLTKLGVPVPENSTERVAQDVAGSLTGIGGLAKAAQLASPTSAVGRGVARTLQEALAQQAAATAAASGSAGVTRESGGGPAAQLAAGLAAGVAAPMAAQAIKQAVPNVVAASVRKSEQTPFAQEGQRLRQGTGIDLTTGQETGNKMVLGLENTARQYGPLADRVQDTDIKIAKQAIDRVESIANDITNRRVDPATLGTQIEDTVKNAATQLDNLRETKAATDYGRVRELAGDRPVIKLDNFAGELRNIVDEYKNVVGADAQKVTAQAQAALNRITGTTPANVPGLVAGLNGEPLKPGTAAVTGTTDNTISEAMRSRRYYGKAARGSANVFEDIAPDMNRAIGARLFRAINQDFDNAAVNSNGELRTALDTANGNFRKATQSIEFLEKSTLGKLVGEDVVDAAMSGAKMSTTAGETIVARLGSAAPSSRKAAIDILNTWNPELAKDVRANVLREALDKAMSIPPSQKGASQVPLSFNRFISAIQGEKTSFERQLQSYGFEPKEIGDIKDTVAAMMRAGDRTGYNASGTYVQSQNMEVASAIGAGLLGNLKGAATKGLAIAGKYVGLSQIVHAMETSVGRQALRTISSPQASPQAVAAAFETVESEPPAERHLYWTSKGGQAIRALDGASPPANLNARMVESATRWVSSQAGPHGRIVNPERLARALEKTDPRFRHAVVDELIRQGRVPALRAEQ